MGSVVIIIAMENYEKGRESMLQALAIMRDNEEYQRKYASVPDIVSGRRETSITILCDMISRLKKEVDVKNKCVHLLEDVAGWWKDVTEDRERLTQRNKELQAANEELRKKVEELLEAKLAEGSGSSCEWNSNNANAKRGGINKVYVSESSDEVSSGNKGDGSNSMEEVEVIQPSDSCMKNNNASSEDGKNGGISFKPSFGISRSVNHVHGSNTDSDKDVEWMPSQSSSRDYSYPLLTVNPYDTLDPSYYNPTQFFQRLSTTNIRRGKAKRGAVSGEGRGGRGKKSVTETASAKRNAGHTPGPGPKKRNYSLEPDPEPIIEVEHSPSYGSDENEMDQSASVSNYENIEQDNKQESDQGVGVGTVGEAQQEESPDKSYYDYTSTFLDETNNLCDI